VGEAVAIATIGGIFGTLIAALFLAAGTHAPQGANIFIIALHEWRFTAPTAWVIALLAGFLSSASPAYAASRTGIVEGLRHIG
jgi:ABC-type antimicrobial peptide transport system permease subunit